jgi:hypothetical protein
MHLTGLLDSLLDGDKKEASYKVECKTWLEAFRGRVSYDCHFLVVSTSKCTNYCTMRMRSCPASVAMVSFFYASSTSFPYVRSKHSYVFGSALYSYHHCNLSLILTLSFARC